PVYYLLQHIKMFFFIIMSEIDIVYINFHWKIMQGSASSTSPSFKNPWPDASIVPCPENRAAVSA
ncbi:hypothetical protein KUCAC02_018577, partial [Chaenocephalus aceratus]